MEREREREREREERENEGQRESQQHHNNTLRSLQTPSPQLWTHSRSLAFRRFTATLVLRRRATKFSESIASSASRMATLVDVKYRPVRHETQKRSTFRSRLQRRIDTTHPSTDARSWTAYRRRREMQAWQRGPRSSAAASSDDSTRGRPHSSHPMNDTQARGQQHLRRRTRCFRMAKRARSSTLENPSRTLYRMRTSSVGSSITASISIGTTPVRRARPCTISVSAASATRVQRLHCTALRRMSASCSHTPSDACQGSNAAMARQWMVTTRHHRQYAPARRPGGGTRAFRRTTAVGGHQAGRRTPPAGGTPCLCC
jgi:hypothetical protein